MYEDANIYHYYFHVAGVKEPIIIESANKKTAIILVDIKLKRIGKTFNDVENITIHSLVTGVSKKSDGVENYIWLKGMGWVLEKEFLEMKKIYNERKS